MEINFEERLRKVCADIGRTTKEFAEWKGEFDHLSELKKTVLAEQVRNQVDSMSYVEKETRARCAEEYKTHLQGVDFANKKMLVAKAELDTAKATHEALIALLYGENARIKAGIDA